LAYMSLRIGIDVGGTNTDAVLMDDRMVVSSHKTPTTANISDGVITAISRILDRAVVSAEELDAVMIGTTQFTNAFVERRNLLPVGVIRLALPATAGLPPMIDWPADIAKVIGTHCYMVRGGYEFDGRVISPLDELAIKRAAVELRNLGVKAVAICGVFSPINSDMEERAAAIIQQEIPGVAVTLSSRIGRISLLERENAAIMNASLTDLSHKVVTSFRHALTQLNIKAPFHISQNDGTLMTADFVEKYPVLTFASGPTNSMRGAAYLSGVKDALVVDIGGTTTDIGMLIKGFPRESTMAVDIGGVRTNFRMPDVISLGLGGGSVVNPTDATNIGPLSVGFRLTEKALVFGGDTLTTTDIAVAAGYADVGDRQRVAHLSSDFINSAVQRIHALIADGVDRMKTSAEPVPLIMVGGGSILVNQDIPGTSDLIVPENASVANAIGASIAQVGGVVDKVYSYERMGRKQSIEDAKHQAIAVAVEAGAVKETVKVIELEEIPLSYMPGNAVRLRVKAAGELSLC